MDRMDLINSIIYKFEYVTIILQLEKVQSCMEGVSY